jgi:hypothetical protein
MHLVLKLDTVNRKASLESYDADGNLVETLDDVKEMTFRNYDNSSMMARQEYLLAGTAIVQGDNGEFRIRRFIDPKSDRFSDATGQQSRQHPVVSAAAPVPTPNLGVLHYMPDVIIRLEDIRPRG